jgi:molybdopterin molybdotransferase
MITVSELQARLDALIRPLPSELVGLDEAVGRVLRQPILADADQPPFDRSAIDGYLLRADETASVVKLSGQHPPGQPPPALPAPGFAARIFTGSAVPAEGAALIMQEDCEVLPEHRLRLNRQPSTSLIRPQGSQARRGDCLLPSGIRLSAGPISLLASAGVVYPQVTRQARAAHLVTGGELVPADQTPALGCIRDSNTHLIAALLKEAGAERIWHGRVDDSRIATAAALAEAVATGADLVLVSGGASVGEADHTASLLVELGFELHASKVASRPGKPFIAASRGTQLAFGLPGNPLSHFVCFHLFVRRALDRMAGVDPVSLRRARLDGAEPPKPDPRETWWPCALETGESALVARPLGWRDSSDLTALGHADGLLRVPAGAPAGQEVEVLPCRHL